MYGKMSVRTDFGPIMFTNTMILFFASFCILGAFGQGIIVHPKNATVMEGDDVTLQCEFNKLINECVWVHNGIPVKIGGRYQYSDKKSANGKNTKNCSLLIKAFEKMDASKWHCHDLHNYNRSISDTAYLTLAITVSDYPRNATIVVGSDIVLHCKLSDDNASCVWLRNGSTIHIKDRYKYMYNKVNINDGNNTMDCSIKISNISKMDATRWQCSCQSNSETGHENCKSSPAYLSLEPLELSAESTMNKTKVIQDVNVSKESPHHDNDFVNIVLYSLIGFLLATVALLVFIYYRRANKAKKKASTESTLTIARLGDNSLCHSTPSNIHQSTDSLCDKHDLGPRSPASIRSLQKFDRRDNPIPLPQQDNCLPSYDQTKPDKQCDYDECSNQQNKQVTSDRWSASPLYETVPTTDATEPGIRKEHPQFRTKTLTNSIGSTTLNPVYQSLYQKERYNGQNRQRLLTNSSGSTTCNPLYEPIEADATEPEADGDAKSVA